MNQVGKFLMVNIPGCCNDGSGGDIILMHPEDKFLAGEEREALSSPQYGFRKRVSVEDSLSEKFEGNLVR